MPTQLDSENERPEWVDWVISPCSEISVNDRPEPGKFWPLATLTETQFANDRKREASGRMVALERPGCDRVNTTK